jgi:hypothetical protein
MDDLARRFDTVRERYGVGIVDVPGAQVLGEVAERLASDAARIEELEAQVREARDAAHSVIRMADQIPLSQAAAERWADRIDERMVALLARLSTEGETR